VTWEVCAAGRGVGGGVEPGINPEERRHLRWTPPRKTLPMCEAKQFGHFGNKKNTHQNAEFDDKGEVDKGERVKSYQENGRPKPDCESLRYTLSVCTYHLFLCPRSALGRPVEMRTIPRTPKARSILVARTVGLGVGVNNVEAVTFGHELVVGVGTAIVRVTLWTVGKTLTIARVWEPELAREVQ